MSVWRLFELNHGSSHAHMYVTQIFPREYNELQVARGQEVQTLVNEELKAGTYKVDFDGTKLASGIYFYTLFVGDPSTGSGQSFTQTKKMLMIK